MAWQQTGNLKGPAGTLAVGTVTTGAAGSAAQINNIGTAQAATFDFVIPKGDKGDDGKGVSIAGTVNTYADLPTTLTAADSGKGYFVRADGDLYTWDGSAFPADGSGTAFQGPPGATPAIGIGTVTSTAYGTSPSVTNSGTPTAPVFNFGFPQAKSGIDGKAATIAIGTVTTGAAGSAASVVNNGTAQAASLDITIPAGAAGARGTKFFSSHGAPGTIPGAAPGDQYLDLDSGITYELS